MIASALFVCAALQAGPPAPAGPVPLGPAVLAGAGGGFVVRVVRVDGIAPAELERAARLLRDGNRGLPHVVAVVAPNGRYLLLCGDADLVEAGIRFVALFRTCRRGPGPGGAVSLDQPAGCA